MVAAQVRRARQRADKDGKVPREPLNFVLSPDGVCIRRVISHDLSLPVQARQVPLLTGVAGTAASVWRHPRSAITAGCVHDARSRYGQVRG